MLNYIKRLFGIKPTETKVEVEVPATPYKVESPALAVPVTPAVEPVVAPVVETTTPVVESTTEVEAPAAAKKAKAPAKKKTKKTV